MYGSIYRLYSFNSHFVDRQLFFRIYFNVALTRNSTYSNVNSWFSTANTPAVALSISAGACCFRRTVLSTWSLWLLSSHTPTSNPPAYPPAKAAYLPWKHTQNECFLPTAGADWQHAHMHVRWSPVSVSAPMVCSQHGGQRGPLGPKVITAIPLSNSSKGCSFHTEEPHILNHLLQRCLSRDPVHLLAGLAAAAFNMSSSACSPLQAFTDHCCLGWNTLLGDSLTVHSLTSPSRLHWNINVTSEAFSNHNIK